MKMVAELAPETKMAPEKVAPKMAPEKVAPEKVAPETKMAPEKVAPEMAPEKWRRKWRRESGAELDLALDEFRSLGDDLNLFKMIKDAINDRSRHSLL